MVQADCLAAAGCCRACARNGMDDYMCRSAPLPAVPIIYCAERINRLAAQHWRSFAKQNYFDPQASFQLCVLALLVLACCVHSHTL